MDVDRTIVYEVLQNGLGEIEESTTPPQAAGYGIGSSVNTFAASGGEYNPKRFKRVFARFL